MIGKARFFEVSGLSVFVSERQVLANVSFFLKRGEVVGLMGPNGGGKSSLAMTIIGNPGYRVVEEDNPSIILEGKELIDKRIDERVRAGIFLGWQSPVAIPGVSVFAMAKAAYRANHGEVETTILEFKRKLEKLLERVGLESAVLGKDLNDSFSGGEKKRLELFMMLLLRPKLVILDEIDSGLDVDGMRLVGDIVGEMRAEGSSFILITHYRRLLKYIVPDRVIVLKQGRVVESGGVEIIEKIEENGYKDIN